jgi:hypothetical protein
MTSHRETPTIPDRPRARPRRRFSEGIERMPLTRSLRHVGRFSDGLVRSSRTASAKRIGSFSDGLAQRPDASSAHRVGSFADGFAQGGGDPRAVPRVDSERSRLEGSIAA